MRSYQKEDKFNQCEKSLLRKGDILTPIGVYRAAMANNGILEKNHFVELVRINYFIEEDQDLPKEIVSEISEAWKKSEKFFEELDIIIEFGEKRIIVNDPEECFEI